MSEALLRVEDDTQPAPLRLSAREEAFCHAYVAMNLNGTAAAEAVGLKQPVMAGSRMMRKDHIAARIRELLEPKLRRWDLTADRVLAEVAKVAYFNMGDALFVTEAGDPYIDLSNLDKDQMAALGQVEIEDFVDRRETGEDGKPIARDVRRVKVKPHDKLKALELGMRHLRLLHDRVEVAFSEDTAQDLTRARERALKMVQSKQETDQ